MMCKTQTKWQLKEIQQELFLSKTFWSEVKSLSRIRLCDPMDCSLPGFSVRGIFQARVLEWIAMSFSRGSSRPRNRTRVSRTAGRCFTYRLSHQGSPWMSHNNNSGYSDTRETHYSPDAATCWNFTYIISLNPYHSLMSLVFLYLTGYFYPIYR